MQTDGSFIIASEMEHLFAHHVELRLHLTGWSRSQGTSLDFGSSYHKQEDHHENGVMCRA